MVIEPMSGGGIGKIGGYKNVTIGFLVKKITLKLVKCQNLKKMMKKSF